jgi:hypothetical protein
VTRRLRLALLLAALVVSGPMPSLRAADAARLDVSIAWFCSERIVVSSRQNSADAIDWTDAARSGFNPHPSPQLPAEPLSYSQFQRPPPV